jgi:iron complex transport system ATP-binding protein
MIRTENLVFGYHKHVPVLKELSVDFDADLNVIIGPNACGKSTLLKCLFGLLNYEGKVFWNNQDLSKLDFEEKAQLMAYLPQGDVENTSLTIFETVLLGKVASLSWKVTDDQLDEVYNVLNTMNLLPIYDKKINELSGGQKKLVTIAQTLIREPELIIMDEPTNNLDIQKQLELFDIIRQIIKHKKIKFIIVLHDINVSTRYADKIIVLNDGKKYACGQPEEIINVAMLKDVYGVHGKLVKDQNDTTFVVAESSVNEINLFGKE